jgi:acetolactate synthase-1/2/3 large subunit
MESLPDFVKLAEAFGAVGLRCHEPAKLDDTIREMIKINKPVIVDVLVDKTENCFPMIPSGAAHCDMLLGPDDRAEKPVSEEGMVLV